MAQTNDPATRPLTASALLGQRNLRVMREIEVLQKDAH
jgi:hypothetical protein